jgi:gliding motility-associated-like protein
MRTAISLLYIILFVALLKAQAPTVASSSVQVDSKFCSQVTLSWTNGNGGSRIVVASKGSAVTSVPSNDVYYLANDSFGNGGMLSATEFVVFNGSTNTTIVENLESNTTYHFKIFEYNGSGQTFDYLISSTVTFTVLTNNLIVNFTIDDPHQCQRGNLSSFTPSITQTVATAVTYAWDFDDGNTSSLQNPTHSYGLFGIYEVEVDVSSYRCQASFIAEDSVAPEPVVGFVLDNTVPGNFQEQCFLKPDGSTNYFKFNKIADFNSLGTPFSRTDSYWYYGDGKSDIGAGNGNNSYTNPGVYTVRLIAISTQNNIDFCTDSFDMTVEVRARPIDTALIEFDSAHCLNNNLFEFENNTADLATVSSWDFGDGNTDVGQSVTHNYSLVGEFEFTLEVVDAYGCYDIYQDSVEVVAQPNNDFSGLDIRYCLGDPNVILTPVLADGIWFGDNIDASNGEFSPSQLGLNTVSHTVDEFGCKDTVSYTTTVYQVPTFELGNDTSICVGTDFIRRIDKGASTVSWSTGATDSFTTVTAEGILWAERTEGGCTFRDSINITIIQAPSVNLGRDSLMCGDGVRVVDVRAAEGVYTWNDGYTGEGQRSITQTGVYSVTVTNKCGTATDEVDLEFLPYVCDIFIPNAFTPNDDGTNDEFRPLGNVELIGMQVFNRWGEQLYENTEDEFSWDGNYQNEAAQAGHYYFVIRYLLPQDGGELVKILSGEFYLIR